MVTPATRTAASRATTLGSLPVEAEIRTEDLESTATAQDEETEEAAEEARKAEVSNGPGQARGRKAEPKR
jgi:predicted ATP-grasp superfamily ATP-dependent carboligase